jgi:hypothetical protein
LSALEDFKNNLKNRIWAPVQERNFIILTKCQIPKEMTPDEEYIQIRIKSMRIAHPRIGARLFHGAVFGSVSLTSVSGKATFNIVDTPDSLQNLDGRNVNKIIALDQSIVGPVPYRGEDVKIELGLFSVLSQNLVNLYLTAITDLSKVAGVKSVNQAIPFVQPIDNFVNLLLGADQNNKLEIGIKKDFSKAGFYAVIDASKDELARQGISLQNLVLDANNHLVTQDAREVQFPYFVFSIETQPKRDDWREIPDLRDAYNNMTSAIRAREPKSITEFFNIFEALIKTHPDIVLKHANLVVNAVKEQQVDPWISKLTPSKGISPGLEETREPRILKLEDIQV